MRTAACVCGQLKAHCEGEPLRVSICHCLTCQRRTGSAFAITSRWAADRVTVEGRSHLYVRPNDEGKKATFHSCATCTATVYYEHEAMPGMVAVPVGAFADPTFPPPRFSVFSNRRHAWAVMPNLETEELY